MNDELTRVREWAQDKLDAEHEPPWATRRYLHVVALIDQMLAPRTPRTRRPDNVVQLDFTRRPRGWDRRSCRPGRSKG
ncbi:MAG TPA: hypothetical protein VGV09_20245 [Steroidobacteraceae bacterium]|nr:hypothetical protein [Steroidobacteraceae bacterium]